MSTFNNDAFLAAQKTAVDTLLSVVNTALASAERVAALNLHATREAFEDMASNGKAVLSVKSPQDAMALPANMAQPHIEKGVAYTRSVYEITSAAREDATAIVEGKFEEFKKSMATLADKIATTSPVGSEVAIATLKSAVDSANQAFARFNDAMNQFKELTENNVALVGNAAVKAVPKSKRS
ncbi:MAG: phasin family protein [Fluviibacter sp.]|jgi:phasin family protein|nr:phasin family protein [Rhodocyclales bacterium]